MVPLDFLRAKIIYKVTWHKCFCSLCANIPQKKYATYFVCNLFIHYSTLWTAGSCHQQFIQQFDK